MKRIGILTFHRADNYGAVLQNYALQQALKRLYVQPETIDYRCEEIEAAYSSQYKERYRNDCNVKQTTKHVLSYLCNYRIRKRRKSKFDLFRKKYLSLSESYRFEDLTCEATILGYDEIIVGSDQIWNSSIVGAPLNRIYFLDFPTRMECKKIAYAASAGNPKFLNPDSLKKIQSFDFVSVREYSLKTYLENKGIAAESDCDPVFLLEARSWIAGLNLKKSDEKYLFLYFVENGKNACRLAKGIAHERQLPIHYAATFNFDTLAIGKNVFSGGPIEFLEEIWNADFVVASSFHAVAFSIIFQKDFVVILHEETGSRVSDLLTLLGLSDRIVTDVKKCRDRNIAPIDYVAVNKKLNDYRTKSMEILRKIVE